MERSTDIHLKAVVFDWDLTLWNSWDIYMALMNQTAEVLGSSEPAPGDLGIEYSCPFLEHLARFFPGNQKRTLDTYIGYYHTKVGQE